MVTDSLPSTQLEYILMEYPDKPWDWNRVAANPGIDEGNWNHHFQSKNPNITLNYILENPKGWDITQLILNKGLSTKEKIILCEKLDK